MSETTSADKMREYKRNWARQHPTYARLTPEQKEHIGLFDDDEEILKAAIAYLRADGVL